MELAINICQTSVICFLSVLFLAKVDEERTFPKWLIMPITVFGIYPVVVMIISALYIVWA